MAKAKKKPSRKKQPRSHAQSEQVAKRAIQRVTMALDCHRLLFLWLAKPVSGSPAFPPDLRTADKFFYERMDDVASGVRRRPDLRTADKFFYERMDDVASGVRRRLDTIYLIKPELIQREAEAKDYVLENVDPNALTIHMVRFERLDLQLLIDSSAAIAHECLQLEMQTKNARAKDCASRARKVLCPKGMPAWPLKEELAVAWTYLADLEAVIDAFTTQAVPPIGYDFEFLPTAVRYRGRKMPLGNGAAKNALIEYARCFGDVVAHELIPGNRKSQKSCEPFRKAIERIKAALEAAEVPCKLESDHGKGYWLGPIDE